MNSAFQAVSVMQPVLRTIMTDCNAVQELLRRNTRSISINFLYDL